MQNKRNRSFASQLSCTPLPPGTMLVILSTSGPVRAKSTQVFVSPILHRPSNIVSGGWQGGASSYQLAYDLRLFRTDRTCLCRPSATSAELVSMSLSCKVCRAGLHFSLIFQGPQPQTEERTQTRAPMRLPERVAQAEPRTETIVKRGENDGNHTETIAKAPRGATGARVE